MKLICSAGHGHDTGNMYHQWWRGPKNPGSRCGEVIRYDRVSGSERCHRLLKQAVTITAIQRNGEWTWRMDGEKSMESSREFTTERDAMDDAKKIAKACGLLISPNTEVARESGE